MTLQKDIDGTESKLLHQFVDFNGRRVLEVGCGEGRLTWKYAKETRFAVAIDVDRDALRVARVDLPAGLESIVHLTCADSTYIPFAKEKFDIAILAWSL